MAPTIIRDVITEYHKTRVDLIFFKKTSIFNLFFKLNFSNPNIKKFNNNSSIIEISSFSQLFYWLINNNKNYNLFILHGIWTPLILLTSLYLSISRKPFCFHPHGALDPFDLNKKKKFLKNIFGIIFYNLIFNFSSGLIFTSILEAKRSKTFGAKPFKYIATLSSPFKEIGEELSIYQTKNLRDKYQIEENQRILLFLSRIDSKKGLDILLKSLKLINEEKKSVVLLIAGSGEKNYTKFIKNLIDKLNLKKYVRFIGHVSGKKKLELFKISDLFILPSLNENFGIAIVESLQNKLPVLITKEVYIHKKIIKNKAGYLCNRNPLQLANLIIKILESDNIKEPEIYLNCFNSNFSRERCAIEHFRIYSELSKVIS